MLLRADAKITRFNLGVNDGVSAGQTIFHLHVHLIPRRDGDVEAPRGGAWGDSSKAVIVCSAQHCNDLTANHHKVITAHISLPTYIPVGQIKLSFQPVS